MANDKGTIAQSPAPWGKEKKSFFPKCKDDSTPLGHNFISAHGCRITVMNQRLKIPVPCTRRSEVHKICKEVQRDRSPFYELRLKTVAVLCVHSAEENGSNPISPVPHLVQKRLFVSCISPKLSIDWTIVKPRQAHRHRVSALPRNVVTPAPPSKLSDLAFFFDLLS